MACQKIRSGYSICISRDVLRNVVMQESLHKMERQTTSGLDDARHVSLLKPTLSRTALFSIVRNLLSHALGSHVQYKHRNTVLKLVAATYFLVYYRSGHASLL